MSLYSKNNSNLWLISVSGHSESKIIKKIFFSFFTRKSIIFQKKFSKTPKATYLSSEIQSDGFPMWFRLKISGKNQKSFFWKVYQKCVKFYWHDLLRACFGSPHFPWESTPIIGVLEIVFLQFLIQQWLRKSSCHHLLYWWIFSRITRDAASETRTRDSIGKHTAL